MESPRISVRTDGKRKWTVAVRELPQAEKARKAFRKQGLLCSAIERHGKKYAFAVDGRHLHAAATS